MKGGAHKVPARLMLALVAAFATLAAATAEAQQDREAAKSGLVRIRCKLDSGGEMTSTGFAWRDSLHVVAALHAVAGCRQVLVRRENGSGTTARVKRGSLVADLALLELAENIGLTPLQHVTTLPDTRGEYFTWGYPHAIAESTDTRTHFAGGQKGGLTTLREAFSGVDQLEELFDGQNYPQDRTTILRVTTTLQPGQSGAPILDRNGRVVAIADGGLLDGWKGINWSIPAHVYLPDLPNSPDPIPTRPSVWAALHSKVTPAEIKTVALPPSDELGGFGTDGELVRVRTMSLADFEALMERQGMPEGNIDFIRSALVSAADFERLSFDIYEDVSTGATLGVPSGLDLVWNGELRALEARTESGAVTMIIGVLPYPTYAEAKVAGRDAFVDKIIGLADWTESPAEMDYSNLDDDFEWANNANFFKGHDRRTGGPASLLLSITVSGSEFLGYAIYGPDDILELEPKDTATLLMMQMSAFNLSGFAAR